MDEEGCVKPEDQEPMTSEDSRATLLRGIICNLFYTVVNLFHNVVRLDQIVTNNILVNLLALKVAHNCYHQFFHDLTVKCLLYNLLFPL